MRVEGQVLSREQMAHLMELGVDTSDTSMVYYNISRDNQPDKWVLGIANKELTSILFSIGITEMKPTYTVGDLIEKLPKRFYNEKLFINLLGGKEFFAWYGEVPETIKSNSSLLNTLYELLCWLAENHKDLLNVITIS